jgi:hypothetical protein
MKKAGLFLAIFTIALFSFFFLIHTKEHEKEGIRETFRDSVRVLNLRIEEFYVKNSNLIAAFDSIGSENIRLQTKRESIKSDWAHAKDEAKKICDTVIINRLDSIFVASEVLCDSILTNKSSQIVTLQGVISNDSSIIDLKDSVISLQGDVISDYKESEKKLKRKALFLKIGGGVLVVLTAISLLN